MYVYYSFSEKTTHTGTVWVTATPKHLNVFQFVKHHLYFRGWVIEFLEGLLTINPKTSSFQLRKMTEWHGCSGMFGMSFLWAPLGTSIGGTSL